MSECNFSFEHYRDILRRYQSAGYRFQSFCDGEKRPKRIYLRHDVDRSLHKAAKIAEVEAELGIRATYFLRLHSKFYNCYSYVGLSYIRTIISAGHELGLHTEFYDMAKIFGLDPPGVFELERRILEEITSQHIGVFSPHRTSGSSSTAEIREQIGVIREQTSLKCTLDPEFFDDLKYVSDSGGEWRSGCPCGYIDKFPVMQILVHPLWWYQDHIELEDPFL